MYEMVAVNLCWKKPNSPLNILFVSNVFDMIFHTQPSMKYWKY